MLGEADVLEFYERTSADVFRYASRLVGGHRGRADDLVQETYLTLVRQVRAGRTEPVDIGWAITTCRSRFIDQIRHAETVERTWHQLFERQAITAPDGPTSAVEALARLNDSQRAVLVLRYIDEMSVGEVAEALGRTVHATESLLMRAKDSLRSAYSSTKGQSDG